MKKIILIVATILLTVACSKDDEPAANNEPFTFLTVGNEWVYVTYDRDNKLVDTFKLEILSEENNLFHLQKDPVNFSFPVWWHITDNAWYRSEKQTVSYTYNLKILPINCYVGLRIYGYKVYSISETVTVPAGTFHNCIKVAEGDGFWAVPPYITWFHKDYGIVRQVEGGSTHELISKNF